MKEGVIDENERMKVILKSVAQQMEQWKEDAPAISISTETEDEVAVLLLEVRDIVEQIDYARAFAALKGIAFLLGCIQEQTVPLSTRTECCGIIATMSQHNPPVQKEMLEAGALKVLSDLYFENPQHQAFQARLVQAMSAIVRQHALAEAVFCQLEQSVPLFQSALRKNGSEALQTLRDRSATAATSRRRRSSPPARRPDPPGWCRGAACRASSARAPGPPCRGA